MVQNPGEYAGGEGSGLRDFGRGLSGAMLFWYGDRKDLI